MKRNVWSWPVFLAVGSIALVAGFVDGIVSNVMARASADLNPTNPNPPTGG